MQYNPILLFKCQGDEQSEGTDDLGKDDFALIIQTEFQRDALKKYGNNVILVDSTHGLTQTQKELSYGTGTDLGNKRTYPPYLIIIKTIINKF